MIRKPEIFRKLIHLGNVIIPLTYLFLIPTRIHMVGILLVISIIFIPIDYSRIRIRWMGRLFHRMFYFMLRPHERKGRLTGASWVFLGSLLTIAFFPKEIAVLALLYMGFGDTVAALVGMQFGRIKIWEKTLEGTLAGLIICIFIAFFFPGLPFSVRVTGAIAAMAVELLPIPIDDNIRIPLLSGTFMMIVSTLSG